MVVDKSTGTRLFGMLFKKKSDSLNLVKGKQGDSIFYPKEGTQNVNQGWKM